MKVKLDDYEVRVLINGLGQQHRSYDAETRKVAVTDGDFSFSGTIQEIIKFRE